MSTPARKNLDSGEDIRLDLDPDETIETDMEAVLRVAALLDDEEQEPPPSAA